MVDVKFRSSLSRQNDKPVQPVSLQILLRKITSGVPTKASALSGSYACELTQALNKLQSLWNHTTAALRTACQAYLHFSLCTQSLYIRQSSPGLGSGRRPHHCQTIFKCKNTQPEPQATSLPFVFLDSGVTWTHSQPMDWSIHGRC